jgi:hypothetical protein
MSTPTSSFQFTESVTGPIKNANSQTLKVIAGLAVFVVFVYFFIGHTKDSTISFPSPFSKSTTVPKPSAPGAPVVPSVSTASSSSSVSMPSFASLPSMLSLPSLPSLSSLTEMTMFSSLLSTPAEKAVMPLKVADVVPTVSSTVSPEVSEEPSEPHMPSAYVDESSNMVEVQSPPTCVYASTAIQKETAPVETKFVPGYSSGDEYAAY